MKNENKLLEAWITEVEITDPTGEIVAVFKRQDEDSFAMNLKRAFNTPDELRELADIVERDMFNSDLSVVKK